MDALARLQKVQHSEIRTAQGMGSMFDFADPDGIQWECLISTQRSSSNGRATRKTPTKHTRGERAFV